MLTILKMNDFKKIECGIDLLISADSYLLEKDISERAITHKLAEHLQKLYPNWHVDCEFNKNLDDIKIISIDHHELLLQMAKYLEKKLNDKEFIGEDIPQRLKESLTQQLYNPKTEYISELDLWLFLWEQDGKITKHHIYPDIIVHHRGTRKNHIVFEAKKTKNRNLRDRLYDLTKLGTLVSAPEYKYKKGIFIDLPVAEDFRRFKSFTRKKVGFKNVFKYEPRYF